MRLLDTETGRFVEVTDICGVRYAILSHMWDHDSGEQSYQDILEIQKSYDSDGLPSGSVTSLSLGWFETVKSLGKRIIQTSSGLLSMDDSIDITASPLSSPTSTSRYRSASAEEMVSADESSHSALSPQHSTHFWNDPRLSEKIRRACGLARAHGYRYMWIDSCCIDKSSSSELSEAINSMYLWYRTAHICYAFLADVPRADDPKRTGSSFRESRWFRRGWTLQELIAPELVVFVSMEWCVFGTKATLGALIEDITGIDRGILAHKTPLDQVSVATRMSWAAKRETTRMEDQAYSLLGIFDIHMPTLYGEGQRSFRRLQEEILRRIPDPTIFAWTYHPVYTYVFPFPNTMQGTREEEENQSELCVFPTLANRSLLASEPSRFRHSGLITPVLHDDYLRRLGLPEDTEMPLSEYSHSAHGMRTEVLIFPVSDIVKYPPDTEAHRWHLMVLPCESSEARGSLLGHLCYLTSGPGGIQSVQSGYVSLVDSESRDSYTLVHLLALSPNDIERFRPLLHLTTVYIPHPERLPAGRDCVILPQRGLKLVLSPWVRALLQAQGYDVVFQDPAPKDEPPCYTLVASSVRAVFTVTFVFMPGTSALAIARGVPRLEATAHCFLHPPLVYQWRRTAFASPGRQRTTPFGDMRFKTSTGGTFTMRLALESVPGPGVTVQVCVEIIDSELEPRSAH